MSDPVRLPRRGSVWRRRIIELIDDGCSHDDDHDMCLAVVGASWPTPSPYADLDDEEGSDAMSLPWLPCAQRDTRWAQNTGSRKRGSRP